jgi:F-type H+-transporting ATPase subunit a
MEFEISHLSGAHLIALLCLATGLVFLFYFFASRNVGIVPHRLQNLAEMVIEFFRDMTSELLGEEGDHWLPFVVTLFSFILVMNLFGIIPGLAPPTSQLSVTAGLAIMVFIIIQFVGIKHHGPINYIKNLVPAGLPTPMLIVLYPLEIVSQLARVFSLSFRLFVSMMIGHGILFMILGLSLVIKFFLIPLPAVGGTLMMGLELVMGVLQAYVFTFLSVLYLSLAISHE